MTNHRISAEVLKACPGDAKFPTDCINKEIAKTKYRAERIPPKGFNKMSEDIQRLGSA